jgi:methylmalonyl-CoA/ethylmalonyl-CoA epimerase
MGHNLELSLHHIGYVVKTIEPAVGRYVERYGYELCTQIIHDPLQKALVQFLRLPGDTAYLEFVAPHSPDSELTNAAKGGGKLHHICYAANELEKTIDRLEDEGMLLISEPKLAVAFAGRRICWLMDPDRLLVELVERQDPSDRCEPAQTIGEAVSEL